MRTSQTCVHDHVGALGGDHREAADEARHQQRHASRPRQVAVEQLVGGRPAVGRVDQRTHRSRTAPRTAPCPTGRTARSRRERRCSSTPARDGRARCPPTPGGSGRRRGLRCAVLIPTGSACGDAPSGFAAARAHWRCTSSTGMICSCSSRQAYQTKTAKAPIRPRIASHQMYQMTAKPQTEAKKATITPGRRVQRHFDRLVVGLRDQLVAARSRSACGANRLLRRGRREAPRNCNAAAATASAIRASGRPTDRR